MFMPTGEKTESVDVMQCVWTGEWPGNRAPRIERPRSTAAPRATASGSPPAHRPASLRPTDPDGDALRYAWEVRREATILSEGGDDEPEPEVLPGLLASPTPPGRPSRPRPNPAPTACS